MPGLANVALAVAGGYVFATQKGVLKWAGAAVGAMFLYSVVTGGAPRFSGAPRLGGCNTCTPPSW